MSTTCVVQARMGSTRLPGKVVADLAGVPALALLLRRLGHLHVEHLVVATSDQPGDDVVAALAEREGVAVVRGPEDDVLARFAAALDAHPADTVVRITADCPLTDARIVEAVLAHHGAVGADYTSNSLLRTFPDGLDVEAISAPALRAAVDEAGDQAEREHVTPFVYRRPDRFALAAVGSGRCLGDERWTVDTPGDLERVRSMVAAVEDPVAASWLDFLAVAPIGCRAPGEPWLRPVVPVGRFTDRAWDVVVDGDAVAAVSLAVHDVGRGEASYVGPTSLRAAALGLLDRALHADEQVVDLQTHIG